jgi:hypothetical protein
MNKRAQGTTRSRYNSIQQPRSRTHRALRTGVAQALESHSTTFRNTRTAPIRDSRNSGARIRHSLQQSCSKCYPSREYADRANFPSGIAYIEAMSRFTRSSTDRNGSLHNTVRCA